MSRLIAPTVFVLVAVWGLTGCSRPAEPQPSDVAAPTSADAPAAAAVPAGEYKTDPSHSSLTFRVNHLGFSHYTAQFTRFNAVMTLDPAHPETASLTATIDPRSLALNAPPKGFHDELMGTAWLNAGAFPQMTFKSTKIEKTSDNTARVTGDLTLKGVTNSVVLDVTYNGGYPGMAGLDPQARIGFTATGRFKRSDFGISYGIPAPGTSMGVSDEVAFTIDTEMLGPKLAR